MTGCLACGSDWFSRTNGTSEVLSSTSVWDLRDLTKTCFSHCIVLFGFRTVFCFLYVIMYAVTQLFQYTHVLNSLLKMLFSHVNCVCPPRLCFWSYLLTEMFMFRLSSNMHLLFWPNLCTSPTNRAVCITADRSWWTLTIAWTVWEAHWYLNTLKCHKLPAPVTS